MPDVSPPQRLDPARQQIGHARWMVWLFALATPGFAVLLVAATWSIGSTSGVRSLATAVVVLGLWLVFLGLLIVPETWYLIRVWRGIPALQVDAWGLVWGDDWSRDLAIEWRDIASISSRRVQSRGYSDRWLLIHPTDRGIPSGLPAVYRWGAWVSQRLYGTAYIIGLGTLRIESEQLLALIRRHYDGEIDLTSIQVGPG
jgi:hypothetical protein